MVIYHHYMSPTDHNSFQHLANDLFAGLRFSANEILCPMFRDIHVAHNTSLIYILHQTLPSFKVYVSGRSESRYKSTSTNVNQPVHQHAH